MEITSITCRWVTFNVDLALGNEKVDHWCYNSKYYAQKWINNCIITSLPFLVISLSTCRPLWKECNRSLYFIAVWEPKCILKYKIFQQICLASKILLIQPIDVIACRLLLGEDAALKHYLEITWSILDTVPCSPRVQNYWTQYKTVFSNYSKCYLK